MELTAARAAHCGERAVRRNAHPSSAPSPSTAARDEQLWIGGDEQVVEQHLAAESVVVSVHDVEAIEGGTDRRALVHARGHSSIEENVIGMRLLLRVDSQLDVRPRVGRERGTIEQAERA